MTSRTWIGGFDNRASDPYLWNPLGAPQPGDSLSMVFGGTMNVIGNDLQGDSVLVGNSPSLEQFPDTINLGQATLSVQTEDQTSVSLTINNYFGDSAVTLNDNDNFGGANITLNEIQGAGRLILNANLAHAGFSDNGPSNSPGLENASFQLNDTHAVINQRLLGVNSGNGILTGFINEHNGSYLEISRGVDNQAIYLSDAVLKLDQPDLVGGDNTINMGWGAQIELAAPSNADSSSAAAYSYQNDVLKIYHTNSPPDTLEVTNGLQSYYPITVSRDVSGNVWLGEQGFSPRTEWFCLKSWYDHIDPRDVRLGDAAIPDCIPATMTTMINRGGFGPAWNGGGWSE